MSRKGDLKERSQKSERRINGGDLRHDTAKKRRASGNRSGDAAGRDRGCTDREGSPSRVKLALHFIRIAMTRAHVTRWILTR